MTGVPGVAHCEMNRQQSDYSMANVNTTVDEALCFLFNNFSKVTVNELKAVTFNFYNDEELVKSKEILLKAAQDAVRDDGDDSGFPRMPKRQGNNKKKLIVDDLFTLHSIVDERNLLSVIPCFVARDLTRIPFLNADSINTLSLMKEVEEMEIRLKSVETSLTTQSYQHTISSETILQTLLTDPADSGSAVAAVHDAAQTDSSDAWNVVKSRYRPPPQIRKSQPVLVSTEQKRKPQKKLFGVAGAGSGAVKSGVEVYKLFVNLLYMLIT